MSEYLLTDAKEIWISVVVSVNRFGRNWDFDVWFSDNRSLEMLEAEYEAEEYEDEEEYEDDETEFQMQNTIDDVIEEYIQEGVSSVFDYINDIIGFFDENCKKLFSLKKTEGHSGNCHFKFDRNLIEEAAKAVLEEGNDEEKRNAEEYLKVIYQN